MRSSVLVLGVAVAVLLTACGTPPWEADPAAGAGVPAQQPSETPTPASSPTPAPAPTPSRIGSPTPKPDPTKTPPMVIDDLASGSTERELRAGALVLAATYWSIRPKTDWTASSVKPLSLSVRADGRGDLQLESVVVRVETLTADGWAAVPAAEVTQPQIGPEADVTSPTSVSASVLVGVVDAEAVALRYTLVYTVAALSRDARAQSVGTDSLVVTLDA